MKKLLLLVLLALGACATEEKYKAHLDQLVGQPESSLISAKGPPDSVYSDGEAKYLTYGYSNSGYVPGIPPTYQTTCNFGICNTVPVGGSPGYSYNNQCKTTFKIVGGRVERWQFRGNACVSK